MELVRSYSSIVVGLPSILDRSASASPVSGPAPRSLRLRPARIAIGAKATLYTKGSDGFITSTAASVATGRSEPVPGWDLSSTPTVDQRLFTAHEKSGLGEGRMSELISCIHCRRVFVYVPSTPFAESAYLRQPYFKHLPQCPGANSDGPVKLPSATPSPKRRTHQLLPNVDAPIYVDDPLSQWISRIDENLIREFFHDAAKDWSGRDRVLSASPRD